MGRWTEATEYFHRTIALCEEHNFHDPLLLARHALGELSSRRSDYDNAARTFQAIIAAERDYVRDIVTPVETFDPESPVSIARAVRRFLGQPESPIAVTTADEFLRRILGS